MNEDEAFYEETHGGSVDFDFQAADPDDARAVMATALSFIAGMFEDCRTDKSRRVHFAAARYLITRKGSVSKIAKEVGVSRQRFHRVLAAIRAAKGLR